MFTACCDRTCWIDALGQVLKRTDQVSKEFRAAAGLLGIRVLDLEPGAVEVVMVIHDRSLKIIRTEFIHENGLPKKLDGVILVPFFIKHHPILEPTAAASSTNIRRVFSAFSGSLARTTPTCLAATSVTVMTGSVKVCSLISNSREATPTRRQRQLGQSHFLQNS